MIQCRCSLYFVFKTIKFPSIFISASGRRLLLCSPGCFFEHALVSKAMHLPGTLVCRIRGCVPRVVRERRQMGRGFPRHCRPAAPPRVHRGPGGCFSNSSSRPTARAKRVVQMHRGSKRVLDSEPHRAVGLRTLQSIHL